MSLGIRSSGTTRDIRAWLTSKAHRRSQGSKGVTPNQMKDEGAILLARGTRLQTGALRARTILENGRRLEADALCMSTDEFLRLIPITARP
jgi:hypothetical protein